MRQLQGDYEKRLAAERMADITTPAIELAADGIDLMKERIAELEEENAALRARVKELEG